MGSMVLHCKEAVGGRGGSAVEIIPGFCAKSSACWADQWLRVEWCNPVIVTQPRAFHLTSLPAPCSLQTWKLSLQLQSLATEQLLLSFTE